MEYNHINSLRATLKKKSLSPESIFEIFPEQLCRNTRVVNLTLMNKHYNFDKETEIMAKENNKVDYFFFITEPWQSRVTY